MKTLLFLLLSVVAGATLARASIYSDRLPGQRKAVDVPALEQNPFVNSTQEVEKAKTKQEEVSLPKLFEAELAKCTVTGLFWSTDPNQRTVLLNGLVVRVGDTFPTELWANGSAFTVKAIDVNRISFAVPGAGDERIIKSFELRVGRPKSIAKPAAKP